MSLKIGTQPRITQVPTEPEIKISTVSPTQQNGTQEAAPSSAENTSIRAELQLSAAALYTQLNSQLVPLQRERPGATEILQNESGVSQLNAQQVGVNSELSANQNQWSAKANPTRTKFPDRNDANNWVGLGKTLSTGSGDDRVEIQMSWEGRVHVNVNGKEEWSGTYKEFQNLTIDTGAGNDSVYNSVDGAKILTGEGNDAVFNDNASNVLIETGDGNDKIGSKGSNNEISTGSGDDFVRTIGNENSVATADGKDRIEIEGDFNRINSGSGNDSLLIQGSYNKARTEDGDDEVYVTQRQDEYHRFIGEGNVVDAGEGVNTVQDSTDD